MIASLQEQGLLLAQRRIQHSYPHCWRHKTPVIFRATQQWFISMDGGSNATSLRQQALQAVADTAFYPAWGRARLQSMIEGRPDWCVSRQRNWGVPMALFVHRDTGALHPRTTELLHQVADRVAEQGLEAWWSLDPASLLGAEAAQYEKLNHTLDVWFDSGSTHSAVLRARGLPYPADLYLEGSDQHRGWFQSSLLTACATEGRAPYRALLTHGFLVDGQGHKMSKSKGNVVSPQKICDTLGADILRLWVANTDYSGEISISDEILKRVTESYRRLRNTIRFLLANLADFQPETDAVAWEQMLELDRYALVLGQDLQQRVVEQAQGGVGQGHYGHYAFHLVVQELTHFCSEDLGGFYLDILKDRLYTTQAQGLPRRSAQTALWHLTHSLLLMLAPILSFTADEAWETLHPNDIVFLHGWHAFPALPAEEAERLRQRWSRLREIKALAHKAMEESRQAGAIGASLQAELHIQVPEADAQLLQSLGEELRFALITSAVTVESAAEAQISVRPSTYQKCDRCWHYRPEVGQSSAHPLLCGRCITNLHGQGESRQHV